MPRRFVAYFRVSTKRQGKSGLGLEAQQESVRELVDREAGTVMASYTEVETGKIADRPELQRAIAHARRSQATLIVAKLDRLSRNASFLLTLQDSGLPLMFADMPGANEMTVGLMAVIAQGEARMISERTKAALQAAKRRGVKLGSSRPGHWTGREHRRRAGQKRGIAACAEENRRLAAEAYRDISSEMQRMRTAGASLQAIADALNAAGHSTRRGKAWGPTQVLRVLQRAEGAAQAAG